MSARVAISNDARGVMLAVLAGLLDGGKVRFYSDATAAPASPGDALPDGSVLLAELDVDTPSESEIDAGVATFSPAGPGAVLVSGSVGWVRVVDAAENGVLDYNVGTVDEAIVVPRLALVAGEPLTLAEWSFALPSFTET